MHYVFYPPRRRLSSEELSNPVRSSSRWQQWRGEEIFWRHESFEFSAPNDSEAQKIAKQKIESSVVEFTFKGEKQRWHWGLFFFEEVARKIEFPELPHNEKRLPSEAA